MAHHPNIHGDGQCGVGGNHPEREVEVAIDGDRVAHHDGGNDAGQIRECIHDTAGEAHSVGGGEVTDQGPDHRADALAEKCNGHEDRNQRRIASEQAGQEASDHQAHADVNGGFARNVEGVCASQQRV